MPTLNSYVDKAGYYILAWAPDTGNITYQTTTDADSALANIGFEPGEELPWQVVSALRAVGLAYVGDSELSTPANKFDPDGQPDELRATTANRLLSELENVGTIDSEQMEEARRVLDVDSSEDDMPAGRTDNLSKELTARCDEMIQANAYTTMLLEEGELTGFSVSDEGGQEYCLRTSVIDFNASHGSAFIYCTAIETVGLDTIEVAVDPGLGDAQIDWNMRAEIYGLICDFLPIITSALRHKEIGAGEPKKDVSIQVNNM